MEYQSQAAGNPFSIQSIMTAHTPKLDENVLISVLGGPQALQSVDHQSGGSRRIRTADTNPPIEKSTFYRG
jgi:hypothetical protein